MIALTITDLNTGLVVLQDIFSDSFIFEVIAMVTDSYDVDHILRDYVVSHFFIQFADCEE